MKKALVLIDFIGCPRNVLLKLRYEDYFKANGWEVISADRIQESNLILFCSCGYTKSEEMRSLELIRNVSALLNGAKCNAIFVVSGCLPKTNYQALQKNHQGYAFGPLEIEKIDAIIEAVIPIRDIPIRNNIADFEREKVVYEQKNRIAIEELKAGINTLNVKKERLCRRFSRILPYERFGQDWQGGDFDNYQLGNKIWSVTTSSGCRCNCSYCAIKFAKGYVKSKPFGELRAEIGEGLSKGYRYVSLIADDNGSYGVDLGTTFPELLLEINKFNENFSLLIDSLSPPDFIELVKHVPFMLKSGRINRICLTIQHVAGGLIDRMNRSYDVNAFKDSLNLAYALLPELIIDSHFIIGFPGETEEDFKQLLAFERALIRMNPLNSIKNFPFTKHENTAANEFLQHTEELIDSRSKRIESEIAKERDFIYTELNHGFFRKMTYNYLQKRLKKLDEKKNLLNNKIWVLERY